MNRRFVTPLAVLVPLLALAGIATNVKVPYVALGPGPTFDTLGEADGKPVVQIDGIEPDTTTGQLRMTTVGVNDQLTLAQALTVWISDRYALAPRETVYPPNVSKDDVRAADQALFTQSERSAELAALHHLGLPVTVRVAQVGEDAPATGVFREGDQIVAVAGEPVTTAGSVQRAVGAAAPGTELAVQVRRDGMDEDVQVTVAARPGDPEKGYLGITTEEVPEVPFTVTFNLADIGGPSAGLMFSLAVVDKLSPGPLNGGLAVAGTGTIDSDGKVGPIGGITHKLDGAVDDGATYFLVPADNCAEALTDVPDGLQLIRVESLDDAIDALATVAAGGDAPTCA
ncbi:PDZ domain-containing protein [Rhodococcus sp. HM1]|uniref:YlbL family protein n=1 Tax=unclassified Rhodococcus (in: high G+C Gram-positive bacteria) TaxID=192944 RepID=UPI0018CED06A|nr:MULTISPECIES: PDZ domain-containing protein [unclassified Rhodococcus (in: high G+C Gram-positive bacteria)]MBH0121875.1 PDZ domain-containing protein [Rhodococcus sp. CX]MCK8670137.1 PDZ domain-containing protein [Rhodococcus sp. HM1]